MSDLHSDDYLTDGLSTAISVAVVPLGITLCLLYLVLSALHPVFVPADGGWIMAGLTLVSAALAGSIVYLWRRGGSTSRRAHLTIALLTIVALANSFVHLLVVPQALHTSNLVLIFVIMGLVFLSRPWFYALLLLSGLLWLGIASARPLADLDQWGWILLFTGFASALLMEQRRRSAVLALRRERELQRHARLLQDLVKAPDLAQADQAGMFRRITESAAPVLRVDRLGIWLFEEGKSLLRLHDLYDSSEATHNGGDVIAKQDYPDYFLALERDRFVAAVDARLDPRTACLSEYLQTFGIGAMLDAPILIRGEVVGVLCHEHRGSTRNWSIEEQTVAASLAEIVALSIQSQERASLERRVFEAERLERMGVLAGGVAHDFNNLLMVVLGNTELLQAELPADSPSQEKLASVHVAATGAAELARQMLAYSGRGVFVTETLDLSALATELVTGWQHAEQGRVRVANHLVHCELPVQADPTQLRQVLLNLLTNAADAGASRIDVNSGFVTLDERAIARCVVAEGVDAGRFCFIEVKDNGAGMNEQVREHMFDPFFTTKASGSGLGLAACLGILKAHRGTIQVDSKPGDGARIRILVPAVAAESLEVQRDSTIATTPGGTVRVWVVEDQQLVRQLTRALLDKSGHQVSAFSGLESLRAQLAAGDLKGPDLALVDLTLADGDGVEAVSLLRDQFPHLPVVLMSGYDSTDALTRITDRSRLKFLKKPFTAQALQSAMNEVMAPVEKLRRIK